MGSDESPSHCDTKRERERGAGHGEKKSQSPSKIPGPLRGRAQSIDWKF